MAFLTEEGAKYIINKLSDPSYIKVDNNLHGKNVKEVIKKLDDKVNNIIADDTVTLSSESNFIKINESGDNIYDGFTGISIKGRTLKNICPVRNATKSNSEHMAFTLTEPLKKNTTYTISYRIKTTQSFVCTSMLSMVRVSGFFDTATTNGIHLHGYTGQLDPTYRYVKTTFTVPNDVDIVCAQINIRNAFSDYSLTENTLTVEDIMILEGDYTNDPYLPTYVRGITGVGSINNLFNPDEVSIGSFNTTTGEEDNTATTYRRTGFIPIDCMKTYLLKMRESKPIKVFYDKTKTILSVVTDGNVFIKPPVGAYYIRFASDEDYFKNILFTENIHGKYSLKIKSIGKNICPTRSKLIRDLPLGYHGYVDDTVIHMNIKCKPHTLYRLTFKNRTTKNIGVVVFGDKIKREGHFTHNTLCQKVVKESCGTEIWGGTGVKNGDTFNSGEYTILHITAGDSPIEDSSETFNYEIDDIMINEVNSESENMETEAFEGFYSDQLLINNDGTIYNVNRESFNSLSWESTKDSGFVEVRVPVAHASSIKFSSEASNISFDHYFVDANYKSIEGYNSYNALGELNIPDNAIFFLYRMRGNAQKSTVKNLSIKLINGVDYIPYQVDEKEILLDYPLMSFPDGTCDEITSDGRLIRRIGRMVFDGNEPLYIASRTDRDHIYLADSFTKDCNGIIGHGQYILSNNFSSFTDLWVSADFYSVTTSNTHAFQIGFTFPTGVYTVDTLKEYFLRNNTEIYYKYANPIVTPINSTTILDNSISDTVKNNICTKKIGKTILDGSEDGWLCSSATFNSDTIISFYIDLAKISKNGSFLKSNIFDWKPYVTSSDIISNPSYEFISNFAYGTVSQLIVGINRKRLATINKDGFKQWLNNNNLTIYYESIIDIEEENLDTATLRLFKDGFIDVCTELMPDISYTVNMDRNSQIERNVKEIHQLNKRVTKLESLYDDLILQNSRTLDLLSLDLEYLKEREDE